MSIPSDLWQEIGKFSSLRELALQRRINHQFRNIGRERIKTNTTENQAVDLIARGIYTDVMATNALGDTVYVECVNGMFLFHDIE